MLVIYELATGRIKQVSLSKSAVPLREQVAPELSPDTFGAFDVPDDENIVGNYFKYLVKMDADNQPYVETRQKKIELACNLADTFPDGRYKMLADGMATADIAISFKAEDGSEAFPTGIMEISTTGGRLSGRVIALNGSQSSIAITLTAPIETITVEISARIMELPEYVPGKLIIEMLPSL